VMDLHSVATTSRSTCVPQMAVWNWLYWIEANDMVAYIWALPDRFDQNCRRTLNPRKAL
jgi:hypothetical protein